MKVTLIDDYAKVELDGRTMTEGHREHLNVRKNKIGLNPGIAGGSIGSFEVSEVPAKDGFANRGHSLLPLPFLIFRI
ncbi:hypothetical protein OAK97_01655 [bacterium]|nr:hypothetical protein [bacterium]MDG1891347.1 hypothetical protein [Verrucomicrobiota bacterium]